MDIRFDSRYLNIDGTDYSDDLEEPAHVECVGDDWMYSGTVRSARHDQLTRVLIRPKRGSALARLLASDNVWTVPVYFVDQDGQRWGMGGLFRRERGSSWLEGPRLEKAP